jgi:hypothetical protein
VEAQVDIEQIFLLQVLQVVNQFQQQLIQFQLAEVVQA